MNSLILIDEPDISLHSSACEYLKEELLKIADTNYVVYTTHSIFMFDRENIPRHVIVKKIDEKTQIKPPEESEIYDDEVLFKEVNYSRFKMLNAKNILFEGYRDKILFITALSKVPSTYSQLKNKFKEIGLAHAKGVGSIGKITPILELAKRQCLILSDNDNPAENSQKSFNEQKLYGIWKRYDEVLVGTTEITAEDFIKKNFIQQIWNKLSIDSYPALEKISDTSKIISQKGIVDFLRRIAEKNYDGSEITKILTLFKEELYKNLKPQNIEENYYEYLQKVVNLL